MIISCLKGYDTSTSTIAACLLMMAMHQDVQSKLYAEINQWMEHDDPESLEDVKKFEYLDMVVRETMRLFPVGAIIGRFSSGNVSLGEFNGNLG
jgi:cytochrome P450